MKIIQKYGITTKNSFNSTLNSVRLSLWYELRDNNYDFSIESQIDNSIGVSEVPVTLSSDPEKQLREFHLLVAQIATKFPADKLAKVIEVLTKIINDYERNGGNNVQG